MDFDLFSYFCGDLRKIVEITNYTSFNYIVYVSVYVSFFYLANILLSDFTVSIDQSHSIKTDIICTAM